MSDGAFDLEGDVVELLRALIDIESVSGNEQRIADAVEAALGPYPHLEVIRDGNVVIARTDLGRDRAGGDRRPSGHRADRRQRPGLGHRRGRRRRSSGAAEPAT